MSTDGERIQRVTDLMRTDGTGVTLVVDLVLCCPSCGKQHLDTGEWETRVHRVHKCETTPEGPNTGCGLLWQPCEGPSRGVRELAPQPAPALDDVVVPLRELENREIKKAMRVTKGSVGKAAKLLGIGRATLYRRLSEMEFYR